MSASSVAIHPIYLQLDAADIAWVKFLFESYEGVGIVRTIDRRAAIIVVLVVSDFLSAARGVLDEIRTSVPCREVNAPPGKNDDWLMREIDD